MLSVVGIVIFGIGSFTSGFLPQPAVISKPKSNTGITIFLKNFVALQFTSIILSFLDAYGKGFGFYQNLSRKNQ
jgi:hypothetical protein